MIIVVNDWLAHTQTFKLAIRAPDNAHSLSAIKAARFLHAVLCEKAGIGRRRGRPDTC